MASSATSNDIVIRIVELKFAKEHSMMEPYVVVKSNGTTFKTSVYKGQDKRVRGFWNESTTVKRSSSTASLPVMFEIYDENVFKDELLAVLTITISSANNMTQNYRLLDKKSNHLGDLFVNFSHPGQAAQATLYGTAAVNTITSAGQVSQVTAQPVAGTVQHATQQQQTYNAYQQQAPQYQQQTYNVYQPQVQTGVYTPTGGVYNPGLPPQNHAYQPPAQYGGYGAYPAPQQQNTYNPHQQQQNTYYPPQQQQQQQQQQQYNSNNAYPLQQNTYAPPQQNNNTYQPYGQHNNNAFPQQQQQNNNAYPQQQNNNTNPSPQHGNNNTYPNSNYNPTPTSYPTNTDAYPTPPGQNQNQTVAAYPTTASAYPTPPNQNQYNQNNNQQQQQQQQQQQNNSYAYAQY